MIRSINHIGIAVKDTTKILPYYISLGFKVFHTEYVKSQDTNITMIHCGNTWIEFVEPASESSPLKKFIEKNGDGKLHHICFEVDSMKDVKECGFDFISDPVDGYAYTTIGFVHPHNTGGVLWEFVQTAWGTRKVNQK